MGWIMLAGALLAVATGLATAAGTPRRRRLGVHLAVGVVATAAVNSALLLGVRTAGVQLLTLGTGLMLLAAVHRWAATLQAGGQRARPTDNHRAERHDDTTRR
jgi:hypothetical protein